MTGGHMFPETPPSPGSTADEARDVYQPPTVTLLGTLAELTQEKEVGASDGTTFLGLDIGS